MRTELRTSAANAAIRQLDTLRHGVRFRAAPLGYLDDWHDNLIDGISTDEFATDLRKGAGEELTDKPNAPARFRAAFSSSALAVNTFAPFRRHAEHLRIGGESGFTEAQFEYSCPNGLRGTDPCFDFFCRSTNTVVAVESKFLEVLTPKTASFADQYLQPLDGTSTTPAVAEAPWAAVFEAVGNDPATYTFLDAAQLLKNYLGLAYSFKNAQCLLVYVYWEPTNAADFVEYVGHRNEVTDFTARVQGAATRFMALSHADLLREWQNHSTWPGMRAHLARLRERYSFPI